MSSMSEPTLPIPPAGKGKGSMAVRGLRTGKIHLKKASASEILQTLGVRPSEARVAEKALQAALARKTKARNTR